MSLQYWISFDQINLYGYTKIAKAVNSHATEHKWHLPGVMLKS